MDLGKQLKTRRFEIGLTQLQVAEQLHVTRQTVSRWELGQSYPNLDTLVALSDLYEISLDKLMREDEVMIRSISKTVSKSSKRKRMIVILLIFFIPLILFLFYQNLQKPELTVVKKGIVKQDVNSYFIKDLELKNGEIYILEGENQSFNLKKGTNVDITFDANDNVGGTLTFGYFLNSAEYKYENLFNILEKNVADKEVVNIKIPVDGKYTFAVIGSSASNRKIKHINLKIY